MEFDEALCWVEMVMNALESSATGASPYFIENGTEFRLPFLTHVVQEQLFDVVDKCELQESIENYAEKKSQQYLSIVKAIVSRL